MAYAVESGCKMKRILVLILVTIFSLVCFLSCGNKKKERDMEEPMFTEIEWAGIEWEKIEFPVDPQEVKIPAGVEAISKKEEAINIGKAIIENFWKNDRYIGYELLAVVHSTNDNVWRFDYSIAQREKTDGTYLLGDVFCVAIDGNHCNIIKAWVEE